MLTEPTRETFAGHEGAVFTVTGTGILASTDHPIEPFGPVELELTRVEDRSRPGVEAFSLLFRGPRAQEFRQANYVLVDKTVGEINLFLVPILDPRPVDDRICYQAIFSRLRDEDK